ncbi:hypothetical protein [Janthinobacterium sp. HH102]|uniref:hypothetical protein n=1 Tax=Janthinobacterium sp. HH102 TaxID=1537274 RepID=UPI0011131204|nr:hypothetical protein [Janthinobacterium sp. HH102]
MKEIDKTAPLHDSVSESLKELKPKTKFAEFTTLWPEIKDAIQRQVKMNAICKNLNSSGFNIPYVTFTRYVQKMTLQENENVHQPVVKSQGAAPFYPVQQLDSLEQDMSNAVASESGSALEKAQRAASVDYSKIARNAEKNNRQK